MMDVAVNGTPSAQESYSGNTPGLAFDKSQATCWGNNKTIPVWLMYEFAEATASTAYSVFCDIAEPSWNSFDWTPSAWEWQGSDDGATWDVIDSQSNQIFSAAEEKIYQLGREVKYKKYRLLITDNNTTNDTWVAVYELKIYWQETEKKQDRKGKPMSLLPAIASPGKQAGMMACLQKQYSGGVSRGY